jgi:hypothetical protein
MEEWADDDDEEENWKEALQDRVNQLELAFQHNNDAAAAESRRRFERQQQQLQQFPVQEMPRVDFSQSLSASARFTASPGEPVRSRHASRHKMQRTSSSHACITGEAAVPAAASRPSRLWNFQRKAVAATVTTPLAQDSRRRSTSIDFVARNIQTVEHHRKRSGSLSGASSRTDSPRHSLTRKSSLDSNRSSSCSHGLRGNRAAAPSDGTSSGAAVFKLSDTEAIRRFVLEDVKTVRTSLAASPVARSQVQCSNACWFMWRCADVHGAVSQRCSALTFSRGLLPELPGVRTRSVRHDIDRRGSAVARILLRHVHVLTAPCPIIILCLASLSRCDILLHALFNDIAAQIVCSSLALHRRCLCIAEVVAISSLARP